MHWKHNTSPVFCAVCFHWSMLHALQHHQTQRHFAHLILSGPLSLVPAVFLTATCCSAFWCISCAKCGNETDEISISSATGRVTWDASETANDSVGLILPRDDWGGRQTSQPLHFTVLVLKFPLTCLNRIATAALVQFTAGSFWAASLLLNNCRNDLYFGREIFWCWIRLLFGGTFNSGDFPTTICVRLHVRILLEQTLQPLKSQPGLQHQFDR